MTRKWNNLSKRGLALFLALVMCLGMLPAAAFAAGEETAVCPVCEGVGTVEGTCPDCEGNGKISVTSECPDCEEPPVCEVCDGKGEVAGEVTVDCDICGGTGEVVDPETGESADCEACEGTGKTTEEGLVSCEACGGSGEAECPTCHGTREVTNTEDCARCEGAGTVERTCPECGGSGTVVKTEEKKAPSYATLDELDAAFETVGETLESGDIQAGINALDAYIAIYNRLSLEDQEANAEALAYAQAYRENLVAALEAEEDDEEYDDPDIDTLVAAGKHTIQIHYQYDGKSRSCGSETCTFTPFVGWYYTIPSHTKYQSSFPSGYVFDHVEYAWNGNNHGYVTEGQTIDIYGTGMAVYFVLKADSSSGGSGGAGTTNPPGSSSGSVGSGSHTFYAQVVYVNKTKTSFTYGNRYSVQSNAKYDYGYTLSRSEFWPERLGVSAPSGYSLVAWQKGDSSGSNFKLGGTWWTANRSGNTTDLYSTIQYQTTVVFTGVQDTVYLIYQGEPPKSTYKLNFNGSGGTVNKQNVYTVTSPETTDDSYGFASVQPDSRTGYEFLGWATYSGATSPNVSFPYTVSSSNNNSTLYAVWRQITTVELTYDANGGTNPPAAQEVNPGSMTYVAGKGSMTNGTSAFLGWSTSPTGTVVYDPGDPITVSTNTTLYAVWQKNADTASYTVEWVDTLGNTLKGTETRGPSTVGSTVSADSGDKKISGYEYLSAQSTESATLAASGTKLTLKFQPKKPTLEVLYQTTFDLLCDDKSSHTRTMNLVAQGSNGEYNEWNPDWCTYSSEVTGSNGTYTWTATLHASYWVNWYGNHDKAANQAEDVPVTFTWDASSGKWVAPSGNIVIHMQGHKTTYTWKNSSEDGGQVWKTVNVSDCLTAPTYDGQTPTKAEDDNYTYKFEKWSDPVTEADGSKVYTAQYTKTPKTPATIKLAVTKDNSAENGKGFTKVDANTSKVSYTVTVTNNNTFDVSGLDIIDALATTIQNGNTQSNDAKITLANVAFTLQNPGDEKAQPITGVTGPTSNTYANNATPPDPDKDGDHTNKLTWKVLPKGTVFKSGAVVTLTYDILVENDSYDDLSVNLKNDVFAGTWKYTPPAPANRMMKAAARSGGYDGSGSASSGASNNVTGSIPGKCPIEVTKKADMATAIPGATVTYTVTIKNLSSTAKNLLFEDVMDSGLTMVNGSLKVISGGSLLPAEGDDPAIITVRGERTATVTYQATVGSDVAVGTQLTNTFTATVQDSPTKSDSGTATVTVKEPDTYTVTFNPNDGSWGDSDQTKTVTGVSQNGTVDDKMPANPTKDKAVFAGWNTKQDGTGTAFTKDTVVNADITVYAQWDDDNYGPTSPTDPTKKNEPDGIPDDWQVTVNYAVKGGTWDSNKQTSLTYFYSLKDKDGKELSPKFVRPTATKAAGYVDPIKWAEGTPEENSDVTKTMDGKTYNASFDLTPENAAVTYPEFKDDDKDDKPDKLPEEKTDSVEAGVKIIVDPNGGEWNHGDNNKWSFVEEDKTFTHTAVEGEEISLAPNPTKTVDDNHYVFMGWKKTETKVDGKVTKILFEAQWSLDNKSDPNADPTLDDDPTKKGDGIPDDWQYTVTYKAVGGTVSFESTVVTKLDDDGKPSANGTAKLAAEHIPTSGPDTSNGYAGTGSWSASKPEVDTVITGNTEFTVTFQKTNGPTVTVKDTDDGGNKGTWKTDPDKDKTLTPDGEGKVKLPGKGDITPPDGKVLDKWKDKDGNTTYEPGKEIEPEGDLTLVPVWKDIDHDKVTVVVENVTATYDSLGHPVTNITVTDDEGNPVGYTITYNTPDGNAPVDVGIYTATVKVGGKEVGKEATVTIGRRSVTITSGSASKTYDGTALTSHRVTVTGDGFVTGQGATYTFTGSQTTVNSSPNYFSYQLNGNTNPANYSISLAYGTLTVNNRPTTPTTPPSGGGGGGGGTYRPSTGGGGGGTGGGTVNIDDPDVPLAGGSELNREDHFAYISGYPDGTVQPTNNITREEVAAIFYRLLTDTSRTIYETDVNDFSDVDSGRWSNRAISTLVNAGILSGYPDGTFRPGQSITRAEFATIAAQFEVVTADVENPFSDTTGHWAENLISFAASKGWVGGYTDGTFKPQRAITRAEAMTLVNNVLEREVDEEGLLADAKQWPDNKKDAWYYYEVLEATNSHDYTRRGSGTVENWTAITND